MKKKIFTKISTVLLASQLAITSIPLQALAEEIGNIEQNSESIEVENGVEAVTDTAELNQTLKDAEDSEDISIEAKQSEDESSLLNEYISVPNKDVEAQQQDIAPTVATVSSSVTVNNWAEFKAAIMDVYVRDIELAANITMVETLIPRGLDKNINGNGFEINANLKQIRLGSANTQAKMENLKIVNTDIYGLFWSSLANVVVTYKDVAHTGRQMIYLPAGELRVEGKVTSFSTVEEVFQGARMTVADNAEVSFESSSTARLISPIRLVAAGGGLRVGTNATLDVVSNAVSISGVSNVSLVNNGNINLVSRSNQAVHLSTGSTMEFNSGSTFKAVAGDTIEEGIEATSGSIYVRSGATFELESKGIQGSVITGGGGSLVFSEGSNFSITNTNPNGSIFGTFVGSSNVTLESADGIQAWNRGGGTLAVQPTYSFNGPLKATFTLFGYLSSVSQTNMWSDSPYFQSTFKTGSTGKITGGSFAKIGIATTSIDAVTTDSTVVTGTGEPKANIEIKANGDVIGSGAIDSVGKYNVTIPKQTSGTVVTAQATVGVVTSNIASTTVERVGIDVTTIHALNTDSTIVTGTAESNSTIEIKIGSNLITSGRVGSDGFYSLTIPKQAVGTVVTAQATLNDVTSNIASTTVTQISEGTITPDAYRVGTSNITGMYTGDVVRANLLVNGVSISTGGTFSNGDFSYYVNPNLVKAGDTVVLVVYDAQGKELDRKIVAVEVHTEGTVTPNTFKVGTSSITGTYMGDVVRANLLVNGRSISWGGSFSDGNFSYFVNSGLIKAGDTVVIVAYDANDKELDRKTVSVEEITQGTVTPNTFKVGTSSITGTYKGDVVRANLLVNGRSISWGGSFTDGNFSYFVNSGLIKVGDIVILVAYDANSKELDRKTVLVEHLVEGSINPSMYTLGTSAITGTFKGDVNFGRLFINGEHVAWGGEYNSDGTFNFYVNQKLIKAGDIVRIEAMHRLSTGTTTVLDTKQVMIHEFSGTIVPSEYTLGTAEITGTFTGDVNFGRLFINGEHATWGGVYNSDGTFSFYVNQNLIKEGDIVRIEAMHRLDTGIPIILDTKQVGIVSAHEGTIAPNSYRIGESIITGTFTGDVNFGRLFINGKHAVWGGTYNSDGSFIFYVNRDLIKVGDEVVIEGLYRSSTGLLTTLDTRQVEMLEE